MAAALAHQRGLGNHATAAILARDGKSPVGSSEDVRVGDNVSLALARQAKALAAKGPLGDKELHALRTTALSGDETISPDERIFLTALTEEGNARSCSPPQAWPMA